MLPDLRGRGGGRDRLLFTCQATVSTLTILMTAVSCSGPATDIPPPHVAIVELFSGGVTEAPKQQVVERDKAHPKVRREPPKSVVSPKVATVRAPNATSPSVSRPASKKASTPPRPNAQTEQQLFREFLEWRKRQGEQP